MTNKQRKAATEKRAVQLMLVYDKNEQITEMVKREQQCNDLATFEAITKELERLYNELDALYAN